MNCRLLVRFLLRWMNEWRGSSVVSQSFSYSVSCARFRIHFWLFDCYSLASLSWLASLLASWCNLNLWFIVEFLVSALLPFSVATPRVHTFCLFCGLFILFFNDFVPFLFHTFLYILFTIILIYHAYSWLFCLKGLHRHCIISYHIIIIIILHDKNFCYCKFVLLAWFCLFCFVQLVSLFVAFARAFWYHVKHSATHWELKTDNRKKAIVNRRWHGFIRDLLAGWHFTYMRCCCFWLLLLAYPPFTNIFF
jgi:hypothetical protein